MMKSLNARIFWCWSLYCIVGCGLLPDMVLGARYLPTRRSIPTQLERNERLRELFQHILESERDAHLSAANQFADQLKLIQKKSTNDFGMLPEPIKDYNDEFGEEYDYQQQQQQQQQRQKQPWRFILLNYAHGAHRNHKLDQSNSNANPKALHNDDMVSSRSQQLMQKLYRGKQQKSSATNANAEASDSTANSSSKNNNNNNNNDLDWITSNSELNSATDYDALYDDVNEKKISQLSSSSMKFDRYRRNGPMVPRNEHLN